ncbi:MAG TPA: serine/threonine-protein kinase, partial [Myxococcaceae bacterium]|nr:serine/threonine-protein kinase [Myxococcaceae bacterium]
GATEEGVFVAMDLVEGTTLKRWVQAEVRPPLEVLRAFVEAGRGLVAAHAVNLVHRDFKPENVLVGRDGRVLVSDFGLARLVDAQDVTPPAPIADPARIRALDSDVTRAGAVIGTPLYMAPEQFAGAPPDERSDQFSFCAALYWGLFQQRPYVPEMLRAHALGLTAPNAPPPLMQPMPADRRIPARVRRAIEWGLQLRPEDRFTTMAALLAELEPTLQRRARAPAYAVAVAGVAVAVVAGAALQRQWTLRAERCTGGPALLAPAWSPTVRDQLQYRLAQMGTQPVPAVVALDVYAQSWLAMHRDACEATALRGEQSESALQLRMDCLDTRLKELQSLTAVLAGADKAMAGQAVDAALGLTSLRACADVAALANVVPLPTEPAARKEAEALRSELADVNALRLAGDYRTALSRAQGAAARAGTLRSRPLEAQALYLRGLLEERVGRPKDGEQTLISAAHAADAGRDDALRVRIASRMVYLATQDLRFAEGHTWEALARAALERSGSNPELEGELLNSAGTLLMGEGRMSEALEDYRRGLSLLESALGKESSKRVLALGNLGGVELKLGQFQEAAAHLEEAVAGIERLRGPDHPTLSAPLNNLALALSELGKGVAAERAADRAIEIARARFGPDHQRVTTALDFKATVLQNERRYEEAIAVYRESMEIKLRTVGPDDPDLAYSHDGIGESLLGLGHTWTAVGELELALALVEEQEPLARGDTRFALARALASTGKDPGRARSLATRAVADYQAASRPEKARAVEEWLSAQP